MNREYKILIVDDEPNNLKLLQQILKDKYKLIFANNGLNAINAVASHSPDLILLDVMMPEMNGYDVCKQLKKNDATSSIPIIFVTAMGDEIDEVKGFDLGAVDYIQKPVSAPVVLRRVQTHLSLVRASDMEDLVHSAIRMLGDAGHYNDKDTGEHIWRMASYASALAKKYGWSEYDAELLKLAAPMHDTGKIGIPDSILKAPRKLTEEEWEIMKEHTNIGFSILTKSTHPVFKMASEIALSHHEKWDGSGYPRGTSGKDIPECSRIVAIADVFDALTMKRPYKEEWPVDKAFKTIQDDSGKHFDPELVDCFLSIQPEIIEIKDRYKF